MTAHKHAEFFRALADGSDMSQWECREPAWDDGVWASAIRWAASIATLPNDYEVRRKPEPPKTETRTYECWAHVDGYLQWGEKGRKMEWTEQWSRVPSEDKTVEVML